MLKRENRLKSKKAFSVTYKNNLVVSNDLIVIYAGKPKTDINLPTRVGFVVSKKIHKRAVRRNRIKRLMREDLRLIFKNKEPVFDILNQFQSLIISAKEDISDRTADDIRNTILILLKKLAKKNI